MGEFVNDRVKIIRDTLSAVAEAGIGRAGIKAFAFMVENSTLSDGALVCSMTYDEIAKSIGITRQALFLSVKKLKEIGVMENKGHGRFYIYL